MYLRDGGISPLPQASLGVRPKLVLCLCPRPLLGHPIDDRTLLVFPLHPVRRVLELDGDARKADGVASSAAGVGSVEGRGGGGGGEEEGREGEQGGRRHFGFKGSGRGKGRG
jgi:hypothetical protein